MEKYYNDAIIGNQNILASFTKQGEILRLLYPTRDYKQMIDFFHVGLKINDSRLVYLHEDINNIYMQQYEEDTNILNTEVLNTYFNLKVVQTDYASIKENVLIRKYKFTNENTINLDLNFLVHSSLTSSPENRVSGMCRNDALIQYNHEYMLCTFSKEKLLSSQINNSKANIEDGKIWDKDYVGMSANSSISYDLGTLKPNETREFELYIFIEDSKIGLDNLEKTIDRIRKIDFRTEYEAVKKYWKKYVKDHNGLELDLAETPKNRKIKQIYTRTILLYSLLVNHETGGISAAVEVDENLKQCGGYQYCWPRDAVFTTTAMDILKMKKEVEKFYKSFCKNTQSRNGMWEQRFFTDGRLAPCWGYQIDETASVIYGVYEHYKNTKELKFLQSNMKMCENALHFLFKYLENIFGEKEEKDLVKKEIEEQVIKEGRQKDQIYKHVSYDLWEMNEGVHLYSLASIYGAFNAMIGMYEEIKPKYENNRLKLEKIAKDIQKIKDEIENIRKYVENNLYDENTKVLRRNTEDSKMDISTIGAVYPFELFGADEKKVLNTVEKINMTLRTYTGGYLRFEQDSYMGGKYPWPVTTLWMAMYYLKAGNKKMAQECFNFVVNSTSSLGFISEQVDNNTMKPSWAIGLGWSHAMFIITLAELLK